MVREEPALGLASAAALRVYRRLLLAEPGSAEERALTERLSYLVARIPEGEMRAYAIKVVETVARVKRK